MYGMVCKTIINHKMILIEVSLVQIGVGMRKSEKNSDFCGVPVGRYTPPGGGGGVPPGKVGVRENLGGKVGVSAAGEIFSDCTCFP